MYALKLTVKKEYSVLDANLLKLIVVFLLIQHLFSTKFCVPALTKKKENNYTIFDLQ